MDRRSQFIYERSNLRVRDSLSIAYNYWIEASRYESPSRAPPSLERSRLFFPLAYKVGRECILAHPFRLAARYDLDPSSYGLPLTFVVTTFIPRP